MVDDTSSHNAKAIQHHKMEEEANGFASELLLPRDWLLGKAERWLNPIELSRMPLPLPRCRPRQL